MAPIKVHGAFLSTATQRVLACLHEKELEFEFVPIDMFAREHKKEPFISFNEKVLSASDSSDRVPFGQVPAFEDGDLKLFESRAITQYISHNYKINGTPLIYEGPEMALMSVWMEVEAQKFDQIGSKLVFEFKVKPMLGMTTDPDVVAENEAKLGKILDVCEARLAESRYIGGDTFTLADLHHLPVIQVLMDTQSKQLFDSRPLVSAWRGNILDRPAWLKVLEMK